MTYHLLSFLIYFTYSLNINPLTIWGSCSSYSVHAGTSVSFNGGLTTVSTGNVGVSPGTAITGSFTTLAGSIEANTASAITCASSKLITFGILKNQICTTMNTLAASDLSGLTLLPGVWCSASYAFVISAATLTLDAAGDVNAEWVFQTGTTLITSTATSFILINGAQAKNVYWLVGSSATLAGTSSFVGQITAGVSISVGTNCHINGRVMAGAAVTFAGGDSIVLPLLTTLPLTFDQISSEIATLISNQPPSKYSGPGFTCMFVNYSQQLTNTKNGIVSFIFNLNAGTSPSVVCPDVIQQFLIDIPSLNSIPCSKTCLECRIIEKKRFTMTTLQADLTFKVSGTSTITISILQLILFATLLVFY